MTDAIVVLVTAADAAEAERVARAVVEARLAACANMVPGMRSLFWWEGQIDTAEEVLIVFKTRKEKLEDLVACVRARHSYQVFGTVALPVLGGNPEYLRWIDESVKD